MVSAIRCWSVKAWVSLMSHFWNACIEFMFFFFSLVVYLDIGKVFNLLFIMDLCCILYTLSLLKCNRSQIGPNKRRLWRWTLWKSTNAKSSERQLPKNEGWDLEGNYLTVYVMVFLAWSDSWKVIIILYIFLIVF